MSAEPMHPLLERALRYTAKMAPGTRLWIDDKLFELMWEAMQTEFRTAPGNYLKYGPRWAIRLCDVTIMPRRFYGRR